VKKPAPENQEAENQQPTPPAATVKRILCPLCGNILRLEGFEITEHDDGTWTADPIVECSHNPCQAYFAIEQSRVRFVPRPKRNPPPKLKK
jgi:hypothetical protein